MILVFAVAYLSIGFYAARTTTVLVNGGLMWSESTLWQKLQRAVLFPMQTLIHRLQPYGKVTPLANLRASYDNLIFLKNKPTLFCLFF